MAAARGSWSSKLGHTRRPKNEFGLLLQPDVSLDQRLRQFRNGQIERELKSAAQSLPALILS